MTNTRTASTKEKEDVTTVYPKKYAHGFCFAVLCCGYTLTDFPISIRLTSLALWQSNDCPSASKATLMNMDKYFMGIHYERLHNHNKAKHNKTVCICLGIYCNYWHRRFDILKTRQSLHQGFLFWPVTGRLSIWWLFGFSDICNIFCLWLWKGSQPSEDVTYVKYSPIDSGLARVDTVYR